MNNKILQSVLMSTLVLSMFSCGKSKTENASAAKSEVTQTTEFHTESELTYSFSLNTCSTGSQSADSIEKFCSNLQNNTLNSDCAESNRKLLFASKCKGSFTPFKIEDGKPVAITKSTVIQTRQMKANDVILDVLKLSPESATSLTSSLTTFSCLNSSNDNIEISNGFILLKNSKLLMSRDLDYIFANGKNTSKMDPFVIFSCEENSKKITFPFSRNTAKKKLELGQSTKIPMILSSSGSSEFESELVLITCAEDAVAATKTGLNGITLLKGSKLLVKKDHEMKYIEQDIDGIKKDNIVVSCE